MKGRLMGLMDRSAAPGGQAWLSAVEGCRLAESDAMTARARYDAAELDLFQAERQLDRLSQEAYRYTCVMARQQLYSALVQLSGAQALVMELAHGQRRLAPDDVTTGLSGGQVRILAALLNPDEPPVDGGGEG